MSLSLSIRILYENILLQYLPIFFRFGSDYLSTTEYVNQTFKIGASASNEAVSLIAIEADKTKFVIIEDLSGGTTLTCRINGGSVALGARLLVLTEDLTTIDFSNSDTLAAKYVRIIRAKV